MRLNDMTKKLTQTNAPEAKHDKLSQLKMLVALDALLRHGSVSLAAEELGMQVSSLSRLLQTMRDHFKDPLFTRTGRGLSATAFAETLRLRLRSLAAEADCLSRLDPSSKTPVQQTLPDQSNWEQPSLLQAPPLAARPSLMLDGQPSPQEIANQLATIGHNDEPQRRLAKYIAISSMSSRQSRPLAKAEASDALGLYSLESLIRCKLVHCLQRCNIAAQQLQKLRGFLRRSGHILAAGLKPLAMSILIGQPIYHQGTAAHLGFCNRQCWCAMPDTALPFTAITAKAQTVVSLNLRLAIAG
jgi:molybdenum-dependent DNA-binding transcriptional regulator ModE